MFDFQSDKVIPKVNFVIRRDNLQKLTHMPSWQIVTVVEKTFEKTYSTLLLMTCFKFASLANKVFTGDILIKLQFFNSCLKFLFQDLRSSDFILSNGKHSREFCMSDDRRVVDGSRIAIQETQAYKIHTAIVAYDSFHAHRNLIKSLNSISNRIRDFLLHIDIDSRVCFTCPRTRYSICKILTPVL